MTNNLRETGGFAAASRKLVQQVLVGFVFLLAVLVTQGHAQSGDKILSGEQLQQLVAPIALYPDSLLAQVLMASTYPIEIVQAERWAAANSNLTGQALEDALQAQSWDASVKSIVAFPQVLQMMNDELDWTQTLGNAFLAQQKDVLNAVQTLRARAQNAGSLETTSQQNVSTQTIEGGTSAVVIEPANPQTVYVPTYDPNAVYGDWPYPSYPPYSWYPPGYTAATVGSGIAFGAGAVVGRALWGGCNWGTGSVNINTNNFNQFNRANLTNPNWEHDINHRLGVPYGSTAVAARYGQTAAAYGAREEFRGRAASGQFGAAAAQGIPGGLGAAAGELERGGAAGIAGADEFARRGAAGAAGVGELERQGAAGAAGAGELERRGAAGAAGTGELERRGAAEAGGYNPRALEGVGRGEDVRRESARGAESRNAMGGAYDADRRPAESEAFGRGGGARAPERGGGRRR